MATFTKEQQAAIDAQGRTLVSASAGSGKTTVMIEKIIRLIKKGCKVGEILAVTFTKKAAAQMKEKLGKALIEEINAPTCTPEYRKFLKEQLSEISTADISTIHSFCAKLIRTHFFAVNVDNGFRVIGGEDAEGSVLQNMALDELLEEGYEEKDEDFAHLLSVYWRKKSDRVLRGIFIKTYRELRNRADYLEYLERSRRLDENTFEEICVALKEKLNEKCRYYCQLVEDERAYFLEEEKSAQRDLCNELIELLENAISANDYFSACALVKPKFTTNGGIKKLSSERALHAERIGFLKKRIVKIFDEELKDTLSKEEELEKFLESARTVEALAAYLVRFDEKYERLKAERGVLDYNDLEHKALRLLNDEEIAKEVCEKYRYVFVDEYQDVNPVQEAIISRLGGENLFLVGDVKQAIYGFRGSKSRFFVEKQKEFDLGKGNNLYMSRNFRSSDKVLDAVNAQFALTMTPRVCDVDYARGSYMEKGGRYEPNSGKVHIHFLGEEEKEVAKERGVYSLKAEVGKKDGSESLLAKTVRSIIEDERKNKFFDPDKGEWRQVQYSDIAVLSRKKQGMIARTVESLSAEGVPVTAASAVNICDFSEIKMLIDILSLIDNAEQDVPLCTALLSPMGGLSADDLTNIRLAYKEGKTPFRAASKFYAKEKTDETAYKLRKFYAYFEEIKKRSCVLDAGELLLQIMSDTRMEAELLTRINGVAAIKRIHRFIEEALTPEPLCVHAFLERLRDLEYKIEYSENGGEESVKVLTMHSSKGLEFPIVILDNLSAPFRGVDRDEVYVEEKYGLASYAFDSKKMTKSSTLLRRLHEQREAESSIADDLNLYYVALTRAKYGLHMIFDSRTVMADVKYARSFAEFTDFSVWDEYVVEHQLFDAPKQEPMPLVFRPDENLAREIMRAFTWEYLYTGYENLPVKSSATRLLSGSEDIFEDERVIFDDQTERTDKEIGIAYHAALERVDFSSLYQEDGTFVSVERLQEIAEEVKNEGGMDALNLVSPSKLAEILSNPVFKELQGRRLYKEQKFLVSLPVKDTYALKAGFVPVADDTEEIIFQGAIDLLAVGEDGDVQIVDYKYSKGNAEYLREHYRLQLALYKQAVAKIMKIDEGKIKCSIVNICRGFQVDVD